MFNLGTTKHTDQCENVRIKTIDGRIFDLGKPGTIMFRVNLTLYKLKRRIYG